MSKRTRSHALEDESRAVFGSLLPSEWVFRDESHDYGVDGSIEVFGENGETTGIRMFVQLKGTDSKDLRVQRTLKFRSQTKAYWNLQKHPTLLVRYCSQDRSFYWAWHFDRRIGSEDGRKTRSLKFSERDVWTEDSPNRIKANLVAFARLRESPTVLPIPLKILEVKNAEQTDLDDLLRGEFSSRKSLISYGDLRPENGAISLSLVDGSMCVDFEGLTSFTFPIQKEFPKQLAADVLVALAVGFSILGKFYVVGPLLSEAYQHSSFMAGHEWFIAHPEFSLGLASSLVQARDFALLRKIASYFVAIGAPYECSLPYVGTPIMYTSVLSGSEIEEHQKFLVDHVASLRESYPECLGTAGYNAGEFFLATGKLRLGFRYFRIATQSSDYYARADYLWSQASGLLFRKKRFACAAYGYIRTLRLAKSQRAEKMALLGDVQLRRGRFASALRWLAKAAGSEEFTADPMYSVFVIKLIAGQRLSTLLGVSRVAIRERDAEVLYAKAGLENEPDAYLTLLAAASLNPGEPKIWSALAHLSAKLGDDAAVQNYALFAAAMSDGEVGYWADLMLYHLGAKSELCVLILTAVITGMPDHMAEDIYDRVRLVADENARSLLRDLAKAFSGMPRASSPKLIRVKKRE